MKQFPHTWVIIFILLIIIGVFTWIIPGGKYVEVVTEDGKKLVYESVKSRPQTWQIFSAFYKGFVKQSGIIFFILVIGGSFWILQKSRAIEAGIYSFLRRLDQLKSFSIIKAIGVEFIVVSTIMLVFAFFGAIFGMSEETIAFVALIIPLAISLGFDSIVGVFIVYVAAHVGFAGAMLNPFTIGIAQTIANLPLFSGIEYRMFCFLILVMFTITWGLLYAKKIKKNPNKSSMFQIDNYWRENLKQTDNNSILYKTTKGSWIVFGLISISLILFSLYYPSTTLIIGGDASTSNLKIVFPFIPFLTFLFISLGIWFILRSYHFYILHLLIFSVFFLIIGVLAYQWYLLELSALFLSLGIASGISMNLKANEIVKQFIEGASDILPAAMVVGLAGGIIVIMEESYTLHTILYLASSSIQHVGQIASVGLMYILQTFLNIFIPSGSAKAALTIPILAPFSDLVNVSRQITILAFQFGDGFTNMITPTSGVLMGVLGVARIPYSIWFRWIWLFILFLILIGFLLLLLPLFFKFPGF